MHLSSHATRMLSVGSALTLLAAHPAQLSGVATAASFAPASIVQPLSVLPPGRQKPRGKALSAAGGFGHAGSCPSRPVAFATNSNAIDEIDRSGVCAMLTGFAGPGGLASDRNGDIFVANTGANDIVEVAPPYTGPPVETYQDPGQFPTDVAVDRDGNVAATSLETTSGGPGSIAFYKAGSTGGPTLTVSGSTYTSPRFCAFDRYGDLLFDDYDLFNTGAVNLGVVLQHGTSIIPLTTGNTIAFPGGVQVNDADELAVLDQGDGSGSQIYTYKRTSGPNLGDPIETTPISGNGDTVDFAFTPGSTLFLSAGAALALYRYPAGGAPVKTLSNSPVSSVAIVPTEQFTVR